MEEELAFALGWRVVHQHGLDVVEAFTEPGEHPDILGTLRRMQQLVTDKLTTTDEIRFSCPAAGVAHFSAVVMTPEDLPLLPATRDLLKVKAVQGATSLRQIAGWADEFPLQGLAERYAAAVDAHDQVTVEICTEPVRPMFTVMVGALELQFALGVSHVQGTGQEARIKLAGLSAETPFAAWANTRLRVRVEQAVLAHLSATEGLPGGEVADA